MSKKRIFWIFRYILTNWKSWIRSRKPVKEPIFPKILKVKYTIYPFKGYENLTDGEKMKIFGENCLKEKINLSTNYKKLI